jgi:hypothetical protein
MSTQSWHTIASGKPYLVVAPPAADLPSLGDFLGDAEFGIDSGGGGEPMLVRGHGVSHGEFVRFHEKDCLGGKDVRVWHISERSGGFVAESVAAF